MKQVVRRGLKEIIVDEVPDPMVTNNHVLVRPYYSLISSGTETADIHKEGILKEVAENPSHLRKVYDVMRKTSPVSTIREVAAKFSDYAVLGYSGAGVIVDKDPAVTDLAIGQKVAYGGEGTGHGELLRISRNLAARIPDQVIYQHAAFATLGAIAMNAVRQADIQVGDTVTVIGLGLVGQLISQIASRQGGVVVAVDLQESRVELAKEAGAEFGIISHNAIDAEINTLTDGRGTDVVIVAAASNSPAPVRTAVKICRDRGRLVIVGITPLELPFAEMYQKELKLFMARAYGPGSYDPNYEEKGHDYPLAFVRWTEKRNMEEFLRLVAVGKIDVARLISHEFPLDDAAVAYDTIMDSSVSSLAVLLRYPIVDSTDSPFDIKPKRKIEIPSSQAAPTNGKLRFALVGAGNLARWEHLPAIGRIPKASLRAVVSGRGAKAKAYGIRFKAEYVTSDFQDILNDKDVDVVLIASRHREHAEQVTASLKAGKHVFVEKPMAISLEECTEILSAVASSRKHLTVAFNRRFAPFYMEMKSYLHTRLSPAVINISMVAPYMSGDFWGASADEGGPIIGEAVHMVDLMRFLLDADPVSISAYSLPTGKSDPVGESNLVACFKFADGSIGNLTYTTLGSDSSAGESVEVLAPGLRVRSENFKTLVVNKGAGQKKRSKIWAAKGYDLQMSSFVEKILEGAAPDVTAEDGAKAFLGCYLMLRSAERDGPALAFDSARLLGLD